MDRIEIPGATRAQTTDMFYTPFFANRHADKLRVLLSMRDTHAKVIAAADADPEHLRVGDDIRHRAENIKFDLHAANVPQWANGIRVVKSNWLTYMVVATDTVGI